MKTDYTIRSDILINITWLLDSRHPTTPHTKEFANYMIQLFQLAL